MEGSHIQELDFLRRKVALLEEEEARFRFFVEHMGDVAFAVDLDLRTTYVTPSIEKILGYTVEERMSQEVTEQLTPQSQKLALEKLAAELESEKIENSDKNRSVTLELEYYHKNGSTRCLETYIRGVRDAKGVLKGFYGLSRDITERKRVEEALRQESAFSSNIIRNIAEGLCVCHAIPDHPFVRFTIWNDRMTEITGYAMEEINRRGWYQTVYPDPELQAKAIERMTRMRLGEDISHEEWGITRADGAKRTLSIAAKLLESGSGAVDVMALMQDITERKQAEQALRESEEKYRFFIESANDAVMVHAILGDGRPGPFFLVNELACQQFGYTHEEFAHLTPQELNDPQHLAHIPVVMEKLFTGGHAFFETVMVRKDGGLVPVEISTRLRKIKDSRYIISLVRDITDRKRAETQLRESEERYRLLAENATDTIWTVDMNMRLNYASPSVTRLLGFTIEEAMARTMQEVFTPAASEKAIRAVAERMAMERAGSSEARRPMMMELELIHKDGSLVPVEINASFLRDTTGVPVGLLCIVRDITERKKMEDRMRRLETFEVMGRIAGGVAHDLNNILGVSVGYSDLLVEEKGLSPLLRDSLRKIKASGERAAAVIQDLLTMTRKGAVIRGTVNLNNIIREYLRSPEHTRLEERSPKARLIETSLDSHLMNISASGIHLYKLVMNLVINAVEATIKGGTVNVITENSYLESPIQGYEVIPKGEYAVLTVSDTGEGIPPSDMRHIFEPFYTTKKMKLSGSGLGLSVVWGVVKDHDAFLDVQSEKGKGTSFRLYFPATREELRGEEERKILSEYLGHGERILVVDDEKWQCEMAETMLMQLNYEVKTVLSGEEAVEHLKSNPADLIVLDMLMEPGMDGLDTYREAIRLHPNQKAIIVSGFTETDRSREAQHLGAGPFVRKPYIQKRLGMEIRTELART